MSLSPTKVFQAFLNFVKLFRMSTMYWPLFEVFSRSMMSPIESELASSRVSWAKSRLWMKWAQFSRGFRSLMLWTASLYSKRTRKKPMAFCSLRWTSNCLRLILALSLRRLIMLSDYSEQRRSMRSPSSGY